MNRNTFLISNALILAMAILGIIFPVNILTVVIGWALISAISFAVFGLRTLNRKYRHVLVIATALFILGLIGLFTDNLFGKTLNVVIGLSVWLLIGVEIYIHGVTAYIQKKSGLSTWISNGILGVMFLVAFIHIAIDSITGSTRNNLIGGGLMIFFGICSVLLAISSLYYFYYVYKHDRIPGSLTLFNLNTKTIGSTNIPRELYLSVKNANDEELEKLYEKNTIGEFKEGQEYITVYLHAWKPALDMLGHADVVFKNTSYSLSNYDVENNILGGMATNGVISITPEVEYRNYCLKYQGKVILGYSIPITEEQSKHIQAIVDLFIQDSIHWNPKDISKNKGANTLLEKTNSELRIVEKGEFKNYFALGTNCVKLVDVILNEVGYQTKVSKNLLTPGEYMKFFEEKAKEKDSILIKRMYWQKDNDKINS